MGNIVGAQEKPVSIPTVIVHGGAGEIADELVCGLKRSIKAAVRSGYDTLMKTGNPVDAVEAAVSTMEEDTNFNCGRGSVLTEDGTVEMDASIMDGKKMDGASVSVIRNILHPIQLARRVMENTPHTHLSGEGALKFAKSEGFEILCDGDLVTPAAQEELDDIKRKGLPFGSTVTPGTVGSVAIDAYGNVAAATSTGGLTGKMVGRVGDSPILGAGTYADNTTGCCSCTGHGESIYRFNVSSRILAYVYFEHLTPQEATMKVLDEMTARYKQAAGVISIDKDSNMGIYFTTPRMVWAYIRKNELHYGIDPCEEFIEAVC